MFIANAPFLHFVFQRRGGQTIVPHFEPFLRRAAEKQKAYVGRLFALNMAPLRGLRLCKAERIWG